MPSSRLLERSPDGTACMGFSIPALMGVLNVTPDSFYPGSRAGTADEAVARGLELAEQGAEWIDVGGQSTRPGSERVPLELELERTIPVVRRLVQRLPKGVQVSIDTDKAAVAERALDAGAAMLNDVSAFRDDARMLAVAVRFPKAVVMHRLGDSSKTMQQDPRYGDVFAEVRAFLAKRLEEYLDAGGRRESVLVDPGVGFGKTLEHNLTLVKRAGELAALAPVLLGVSRKSMFSKISPDAGPQDRLAGSLAAASWACRSGVAMLRVHDVLDTRRLFETLAALEAA